MSSNIKSKTRISDNSATRLTEAHEHFSILLLLTKLLLLHQLLIVLVSCELNNPSGWEVNAVVEVAKEEEMVELVGEIKRADLSGLFEAPKAFENVVVVLVAPTNRYMRRRGERNGSTRLLTEAVYASQAFHFKRHVVLM